MRVSTVVLFISIASLLIAALSVDARGRGGGRSSGGRSRSRSRSRSSSGGSSSKPKITKYTPITPTSVRSPVIRSQTRLGSRTSSFSNVVAGYLVARYFLGNAPVYRSGYPMYRCYVKVPTERALRITYEEERLLNATGHSCLSSSTTNGRLIEGIDQNRTSLTTTITYKKSGKTNTVHADEVSLGDIDEQDFEIKTVAQYNVAIVEGTSCSRVEKTVNGTMITLYETNPNKASVLYANTALLVLFTIGVALRVL
ncbi:hypothetical protein P5673_001705 [Acropora cervicornis]|uniref:Uncharacterized protein n=1 Tax=Acropora cervicornis TaxID=6130 RepID=A0AAD9R4L7_ACRCE|nr:hypothetical protein P5673_001705 [Acropora cervicornis]